jgi:hypothetical protein
VGRASTGGDHSAWEDAPRDRLGEQLPNGSVD